MFNSSYETTPCRDYQIKDIIQKIQLNYLDGFLVHSDSLSNTKINGILLVTPEAKDVPIFAHPIEVDLSGVKYLAVDARGWLTKLRDGGYKTNNPLDSKLALLRAKLEWHGTHESMRELTNLGTLPMTVFIRWISASLVQRLALTPDVQVTLSIVAGYYYQSLFDNTEMSEDLKVKRAAVISRGTRIPTSKVLEVADAIEQDGTPLNFTSIQSFIDIAQIATGSVRLKNMNVGLLYTILSGSWFGANSKEIVTVALEHPPTFLALIYQAINERGYRKARLTEYTASSDKQDLGKSFTYNVASILHD